MPLNHRLHVYSHASTRSLCGRWPWPRGFITASSNSMATASNDGSVKLWSFDGAGMGWWGDGLVGIG